MSFQRIRDPLHNIIEFDESKFERKMWDLIQTSPFQRLRRIKQLGFSELVYPGATHTRFAHSLGVFHTARLLMQVVRKDTKITRDDDREKVALAASLLHDVGHGPFSHAFEPLGKRLGLEFADHEKVSDALIRDSEISEVLKAFGSGFATDVASLISHKEESDIYSAVVSSQFDADRLDYMRRDRLMTGTHHGAIDFEWLLSNLEVGAAQAGVDQEPLEPVPTFVLGSKAIYAAETYVLGLFQLYPTVYLHKATRGAEKVFSELLFQIVMLTRNGGVARTGLPDSHPLITFAREPTKLENVLNLDDTVILGSLSILTNASDVCISQLAKDLRSRQLYRCVDIREEMRRLIKVELESRPLAETCAKGFTEFISAGLACLNDKQMQASVMTTISDRTERDYLDKACLYASRQLRVTAEVHNGPPNILLDEAVRKPYRPMQESKGPLEQILMRSEEGALLDVATVSRVIAAVQDFKLLRAYVRRDDPSAQARVKHVIQEGVRYAMAS